MCQISSAQAPSHLTKQQVTWRFGKVGQVPRKPQASSNKLDKLQAIGYCRTITKGYNMDNKTLKRIAKALEELIALVKEDMKPKKKK